MFRNAAPLAGLFAVALAITFACPAAAVTTTSASDAASWAIQPAGPDGVADQRVSLRATLDPGQAVEDQVVVTNFSDTEQTFRVYASDGIVTDDGVFDLLPPDEEPSDGGAWITVGSATDATMPSARNVDAVIAPRGSLVVPVRIAVPDTAAPGDHPAGIVAELVTTDGQVQLATRVGVRVHLRVAGEAVAEISPTQLSATYVPSWNPFAPGTFQITYALANNGNVRAGARAISTVAGPFGLASVSDAVDEREVLPGQSVTTHQDLPGWPLFFSWGALNVTPNAVGEDEKPASLDAVAASFTVWTVPWSQLILILLLVGAVALIRRHRARSEALVKARIAAAVAASAAADLHASPSTNDTPAHAADQQETGKL